MILIAWASPDFAILIRVSRISGISSLNRLRKSVAVIICFGLPEGLPLSPGLNVIDTVVLTMGYQVIIRHIRNN
jgi:hypothetical protein